MDKGKIRRAIGYRLQRVASAIDVAATRLTRQSRETGTDIKIWFATCIGVEYDGKTLPHFIEHYLNIGINKENFLIILNTSSMASAALASALDTLQQRGIEPKTIWAGEYTSAEKQARIALLLDHNVSVTDWVVHADADEFHEYPRSLHELIAEFDGNQINTVQGRLVDRITSDGSLKEVDTAPPIWDQFPVICRVSERILKVQAQDGEKWKLMMYRGYLRSNRGSGQIDRKFDAEARYLKSDFRIHHFKWTSDVIRKLETRVATYKRLDNQWWDLSQNFLDYYKRHGRLRLQDVGVIESHQQNTL